MQKIEFIPADADVELLVPKPLPAKNYLPEWFTSQPKYLGGNPKYENGKIYNRTVKACSPFFDALNFGYIQTLHTDCYFEFDNELNIGYSASPAPFGHREFVSLPTNEGFYNYEFVWAVDWIPKTPPGYSVLITHPFNRIDLPFVTTSGVIDSDDFHHSPSGNLPFYIKEGFNGVIPAGTPIFQIIPFKRDDWKSVTLPFDYNLMMKKSHLIHSKLTDVYRKLFRKKKKFL